MQLLARATKAVKAAAELSQLELKPVVAVVAVTLVAAVVVVRFRVAQYKMVAAVVVRDITTPLAFAL